MSPSMRDRMTALLVWRREKENIALDVPDYRAAKATPERPTLAIGAWLGQGSRRRCHGFKWDYNRFRQSPDFPQSVDCLR